MEKTHLRGWGPDESRKHSILGRIGVEVLPCGKAASLGITKVISHLPDLAPVSTVPRTKDLYLVACFSMV